jgi:predicted permease
LIATLKGAAKGINGGAQGGRTHTGRLLVVGQVALSFVLLIAAGLFVRSFHNLASLDPGYDRDHLLLVDINPELSDYPGDALKRLERQLLERLQAVPGADGATLSSRGLFDYREVSMIVWREGEAPPPPGEGMTPVFDYVGPRYFSTLGMPLLAGREIGPQDEGNAPRVGVINQTMARAYFGDANPIGRRLLADRDHPFDITVVGVVADAKYNHLRERTPSQCYLAYFNSKSQAPRPTFEVRSSANVATASAIRAAVKEVAPSLPAPEIRTMNEIVAQSLTTERAITQLSSFFGLLALLLACVGLYGLMSYKVASRSNELGIRIALGARPRDIFKLVAGQGMTLVLIGVATGLLAAFALTRLISGLLYEVSATDGGAFVVVALLLTFVALLACWIPARRATKVDPMVALRTE